MSTRRIFDVIVIGAGSAGLAAVESACAQGARVCLIEKGKLGGECPNAACIPSKALLRSAAAYRTLGIMRELGLDATGRSFDWKRIQAYRERTVRAITGTEGGERYQHMLKKLKVTLKRGEARLVDAKTVEVAGERVEGRAVVVATGAPDFIPPIDGLHAVRFWGWREALTATRQPKSIAIIGGGPVACELATFYATFGTRVLMLQSAPVVLPREDVEISQRAAHALEALGVEVVTSAEVLSCVNGGMGAIGLKVRVGKQEQVFAVENVVVAAGKRPPRQTMPGVFFAGDADGGLLFTHTASYEGWIAGHNAALVALKRRGTKLKRDERVVPRVTFLDPEVASVGMTAAEVKARHKKALVGRYEISGLGRARTDYHSGGLVKLVADPKSGKILGAHAICPHAGELIHEAALAIYLGATIDTIAEMIHAFPTYSEGLKAAAAAAVIE